MSLDLALLLLYLGLAIARAATLSLENYENSFPKFGDGLSRQHLQRWNDWVKKRSTFSASPFEGNGLANSQFQQWQDWMLKRGDGMAGTDSWDSYPQKFQGWTEWMKKRGMWNSLGLQDWSGNHKSDPMSSQHLQNWMSKRGFVLPRHLSGDADHKKLFQVWQEKPSSSFGNGIGAPRFQSWSDFRKRQLMSQTPRPFGKGSFQSWNDWYKRHAAADESDFGNHPFGGNSNQMMDWRNLYRPALKKRSFSGGEEDYAPESKYEQSNEDITSKNV